MSDLNLPTTSTLTVQVINDRGLPDSSVYLLLTGQTGTVSGDITFLDLSTNPTGCISSGLLTTLTKTSATYQSPYTGNTLLIYEFTVNLTSALCWEESFVHAGFQCRFVTR